MKRFYYLFRRELALNLRQAGDFSVTIIFFVLVSILFPLGIGPLPSLLTKIAPGIIWISALLAALLSLDRIFSIDYEDGTLEQFALSPGSLSLFVSAKLLAHWVTTGLPLIIITPAIALIYNIPIYVLPVLILSMALGTPIISLVGGVGAALSLGAKRGGVLLSLLVMPLLVPVLIFGTAVTETALIGFSPKSPLLLLGGMLLASIAVIPTVTATALRQALE